MFAKVNLKAGEIITTYHGYLRDDAIHGDETDEEARYSMKLDPFNMSINGDSHWPTSPGKGLASYANDGNGPTKGRNNAEFYGIPIRLLQKIK